MNPDIQKHRNTIKKTADKLASLLGMFELHLSETEMEKLLEEEVLPSFLEEEAFYGDTIFSKMDVVRAVHIDSSTKEKVLSLERAIYRMNPDAILWLVDHLYHIKNIIKVLKQLKKGYKVDLSERDIEALENDYVELSDEMLSAFYETSQNYEFEIHKLRQAS